MFLTFHRRPITLIFCIIWSVIATFFVLLDIDNLIRIILNIPLIIFIPGYLLVYVLFPERTEQVFDVVDRIALGIGISIAIVPLFGIVLFFTRWGLSLQLLILSLEAFILIMGAIAIIRWFNTPSEKRYKPMINISIPKHETKFDMLLTLIVVICLIITVSLVIYVIFTPKEEEHFTEFYVLGSNHLAFNYPMNLTSTKNATVILGVANHENTPINYTLEIWLSNQTITYNSITKKNETIAHNLWFMDKINISLEHQPLNLVDMETSQWEYNYTFQITQKGNYKLVFLLYTTPTQDYTKNQDYKTLTTEKADDEQTTAYRNLHLWINVQ
jgi:uncharacterized membrane protein